jgi:predicted lipoprotein with Yx(FWY)xxD motif
MASSIASRVRAAAVVVVGTVLLAACGGQAGTSTAPTTAPTQRTTPSSNLVKTATATVQGKSETVLTNSAGMTLYYYSADKGGKVACTGKCATLWPPLFVPSGVSTPTGTGVTGTLGAAPDPAGGQVVTYNGWPLYTWVEDRKPGDTTGQMVTDSGGTWFVATPDMAVT